MIDPEEMKFLKIMEIIKRAQNLIIKVRREGGDTRNAVELLSEATYALKLKEYDSALEYAKKCTLEIIRIKKDLDLGHPLTIDEMNKLPKEELRELSSRWGLSPIGLKNELLERLIKIADKYDGKLPPYPPKKEEKIEKEATSPVKKEEEGVPSLTIDEAIGEISPGFSYLLEEPRPLKCFKIFKNLMKDNYSGLMFTRSNPKIIKRKYNLDDRISIYWLTDQEDVMELRVSHSLESLIYRIEEFLSAHDRGIILLDGIEYLLGNNSFNAVMRFLRRLVDRTSEAENIFLVSLAPETMDEKDVSLLEREIAPLKLK